MEPTNYGPHSPTRSFHPEVSLHGSPSLDWTTPHDHDRLPVPPGPWAPNQAPGPPAYHYQRRYGVGFDSYQMGLTGGLPLPNPTPQVYSLPYPHPAPQMLNRQWAPGFSPVSAAPVPPSHGGMMHIPSPPMYGLPPAARSGYQPQHSENEPGMGPRSNTTLEAEAQHHRSMYAQQQSANPLSPYAAPVPLSTMTNPQPMTSISQGRRSNYHASPGASSRVSRAPISSPPFGALPHHHDLPGMPPHRRSAHSRARRSLNTRLTVPDLSRDAEEEGIHDSSDHRPGPMDYQTSQGPMDVVDNTPARPMQVSRGTMSEKKMHSKFALRLLESIKIEDLPEKERTCVICYNDFGVETPEGVNESPLRLPKCKHVFGDMCIKRWLEESDSCPYCRDKLQPEPRHHFDGSASQAFLTMMRVRSQLPPGSSEDMYLRLMSSLVHDEELAEARELHILEGRSYRNGGDSDSSTPDGENTASASSSTSASPIRIPPRDGSRFSQWPARVGQQRGAQEREVSRHRRQRVSRNNLPLGAGPTNVEGDSSALSLSPLQTLQPEDSAQSSTAITSASTGENEGFQGLTDAEHQAVETSMAPATQNRNRPW